VRRPPQEALERKAEVESQLYRGTYIAREDREMPFRLCYERWWASRQISETRRHTDAQRAKKHVLPHWGEWPIGAIRPSDIDDWIALLSADGTSVRAEPGVAQADPAAAPCTTPSICRC